MHRMSGEQDFRNQEVRSRESSPGRSYNHDYGTERMDSEEDQVDSKKPDESLSLYGNDGDSFSAVRFHV